MQFLIALDIEPVIVSCLDRGAILSFHTDRSTAVVWLRDCPSTELLGNGIPVIIEPEAFHFAVRHTDPKLL